MKGKRKRIRILSKYSLLVFRGDKRDDRPGGLTRFWIRIDLANQSREFLLFN